MARRKKRAATQTEEQSIPLDALLDDVLGEDTGDVDDSEADPEHEPTDLDMPAIDEEPESVAEEESEPEVDSDPDEGEDPDDGEEQPIAAKGEGEGEGDATEVEPVEENVTEKREKGLLKEISELRRKLVEASAHGQAIPVSTGPQPPAPAAPPPGVTTAPAPIPLPLQISEDGQSVFADAQALEQLIAAKVMQQSQPTPQDMLAQANQHEMQAFIAEDPAANSAVVDRATQADDFIALHVRNLMTQGHQIRNAKEAIYNLRAMGLDQEIQTHFPELAPMFDEFVEGMASGNPTWRRSLLKRISSEVNGVSDHTEEPSPGSIVPKQGNGLRSVKNRPQSLARKGGSRSQSSDPDEKEFEALQNEFDSETIFMEESRFQKLKRLGKKLDKPGFV